MKITYLSVGAYRGVVAWTIKRPGLLIFGSWLKAKMSGAQVPTGRDSPAPNPTIPARQAHEKIIKMPIVKETVPDAAASSRARESVRRRTAEIGRGMKG